MATIRKALPGDLPAITDIYAAAVRTGTATYELEPPDLAEMTARHAGLVAQGYPYIVAEEAGALLGYAYAGPFRARAAYRFIVEDSIYLAPSAQGRGVGRALLAELVAESTRLGFRQIVAVIGDGTPQSASVKLHERSGFRHCGVMQGSGYKHGRWLDTVFMQLAMNGGSASDPDPDSLPERNFRAAASGG
jgi:phosphinothricin acetyltransferase